MPSGQRRLSDRDHGILKLVESLHAHVALCAPGRDDHMAQSGTDQHQRRMTVREGPTTFVLLRISWLINSSTLVVLSFVQCEAGKSM